MDAIAWCRERMLVPGQPLMASLLFAAPEDRDAILALRTLGAELLNLATGTPEPALVRARLGWWQSALAGQADHPALTAFVQTVPKDRVQPSELASLLAAVSEAIVPPRFERFEELWQQGRGLGGQLAALEFRLTTSAGEGPDLALELGAAGWLLRQLRDIAQEARLNRWIVPLDLQAQFQVSRQDVLEARGGPGWDGLVRTLVARSLSLGEAAASGLGPQHRHLLIQWALEKRLGAKLAGRPGQVLHKRLIPGHAGNVWTAWRTARQLRKRSRG